MEEKMNELLDVIDDSDLDVVCVSVSRSAAARNVTVKSNGSGFDPRSRRRNIYLNLYRVEEAALLLRKQHIGYKIFQTRT